MAAELTRLRYRGDSPDSLADALLRLVQHARNSNDVFRFGPTRLAAAVRDGLEVTGPDLHDVTAILAAVPGLASVDD